MNQRSFKSSEEEISPLPSSENESALESPNQADLPQLRQPLVQSKQDQPCDSKQPLEDVHSDSASSNCEISEVSNEVEEVMSKVCGLLNYHLN